MRPHLLEICAFGPYAQRQHVDFDQLGSAELFLVHGATGAGKTSILDALCFALYGVSSGEGRAGRDLRSDFADLDDPTEVKLQFSIGPQRYLIERRPEQPRAKRRGEGATNAPPTATLWQLSKHGEPQLTVIANGTRKVTEAIEGLLGFRAEQFRQVVVLPQGEFRRLLLATSRQREEILEALFSTARFRRLEEILRRNAKTIVTDLRILEHEHQLLLDQAGASDVNQATAQLTEHSSALHRLDREIEKLREKDARQRAQLEQAQRVAQQLDHYASAREQHRELSKAAQERTAQRAQLARGRRAATLRDTQATLQQLREQRRLLDARLSEAALAAAAADQARIASECALSELANHQPEIDRLRQRVDQAQAEAQQRNALAQAQQQYTAARQALERTTAATESLAANASQAQAHLAQLRATRDKLEQEATQVDQLRRAAHAASRSLHWRERRERDELALNAGERLLNEKRSELRRLEEAWDRHRRTVDAQLAQQRAQQIAQLAATLKAGDPCPVCGSTEHPHRASDAAPAVEIALPAESTDRHQLDILRAEIDALTAQQTDLVAAVASAQEALAAVDDGLPLSELEADADRLRVALSEAEAAPKRLEQLVPQIARAELHADNAQHQLQANQHEHAEHQANLQRLAAIVAERQNSLSGQQADLPALQAELSRQLAAIKAAEQRREQSRQHATTTAAQLTSLREQSEQQLQQLKTAEVLFAQRLTQAEFADEQDWRQALAAPEALQALESELSDFDRRLQLAEDQLEQARQQATGLRRPKLDQIKQRSEQTAKRLEQQLIVHAETNQTVKRQQALLQRLQHTADRLVHLTDRYKKLGALAEIAGGRNEHRLSFSQFVLTTLLDDVLTAASLRLRTMSRGRFQLQRARQQENGPIVGALDLEVFDAFSGTQRGASTLSGGEGFLAALSLALGLADVVQARTGGVYLETLFIDEGFGNLDPEALDAALAALLDLRRGGRLVGIISHVPELQERIDARLRVTAGGRGSEIITGEVNLPRRSLAASTFA